MEVSPYPMIYVPTGRPKPAHLRAGSPVIEVRAGHGPDKGGGYLFGPYPELLPSSAWQQVPEECGGWWILMQGQQPQDLRRVDPHPQVISWTTVAGASGEQFWRVPRLLMLEDPGRPKKGYLSALDRVWRGGDSWVADPALAALQETLLAFALGVPVEVKREARNAAFRRAVVALLKLGHHVSDGELIVGGWLTELVQLRIVYAAIGRDEQLAKLEGGAHAL